MDAKYYPLIGGIIVLTVAGFLFWQNNLVKTRNQNQQETGPQIEINKSNQEQNNNMNLSQNNSGELKIETIKEGTGIEAKNGDLVFARYTGYLDNGQVFDSNVGQAEPFSFTLGAGQVIRGWDMGVLGMKVGEKRRLIAPSNLAYGEQGVKSQTGAVVIPSNATLIFEVELVKIGQ